MNEMLKILIIEDEKRVADQLKKMVKAYLCQVTHHIAVLLDLEDAIDHLQTQKVDLVLLDLNLDGEDGYQLLETFPALAHQIIVTTAYKAKAAEAFDYGVLDFVPKPFRKDRLEKALHRWQVRRKAIDHSTQYLVLKHVHRNEIIEVDKVVFIQGDGHHSLLQLESGPSRSHHKSLDQLSQLLPKHFERVHKSYIVNKKAIQQLDILPGSKYFFRTLGGFKVPVGRKFYKRLKEGFI